MSHRAPPSPPTGNARVSRQLAIGFGLVAALATVMCAMLLTTIARVGTIV